jgi:hypothetical protein
MTWQDTKRYKQRKREELERVKLLHDLFFKHPISKNRTERSTASEQSSTHQHPLLV